MLSFRKYYMILITNYVKKNQNFNIKHDIFFGLFLEEWVLRKCELEDYQ